MPTNANRSEKVVVWLTPDLKRRVQAIADNEGRSLSNMCRMALERVVAANPAMSTSDWVKRISEGMDKVIARERERT